MFNAVPEALEQLWVIFSINRSMSMIAMDSLKPMVPNDMEDGGNFGQTGPSALLYLEKLKRKEVD